MPILMPIFFSTAEVPPPNTNTVKNTIRQVADIIGALSDEGIEATRPMAIAPRSPLHHMRNASVFFICLLFLRHKFNGGMSKAVENPRKNKQRNRVINVNAQLMSKTDVIVTTPVDPTMIKISISAKAASEWLISSARK